ncbi:MAG: sigma-70 family RNA polymerase sigma factor [Planctomycetota bacterium]
MLVTESGTSLSRQFLAFRKSGDAEALAKVFEHSAPGLLVLARSAASYGLDAEDLVQTTFVRAIEHRERFDPERPLFGWLAGILGNVVREQTRAGIRAVDPERTKTESYADPADEASWHELATAVDGAVASLPPAYREVISLRVLDGIGAVDIAHQLSCPVPTVRARLQRGLRLLRAALPSGLGVAVTGLMASRGLAQVRHHVLAEGAKIGAQTWPWPWALAMLLAVASATLLLWRTGEAPAAAAHRTALRSAPEAGVAEATRTRAGAAERTPAVATDAAPYALSGVLDAPMGHDWTGAQVLARRGAPTDLDASVADLFAARSKTNLLERDLDAPVLARAAVDARGAFRFEALASRHLRLTVSASDRMPIRAAIVHVPTAAAAYDVGLLSTFAGASVSGRLPADWAGASVELRAARRLSVAVPDDAWLSRAIHSGRLTTTVADDGTFTFRGVWPTPRASVQCRHDNEARVGQVDDVVAGGDHVVQLTPGRASWTIQLATPEDAGLPDDAALRVSLRAGDLATDVISVTADRTGPGSWKCTDLWAGVYSCEVQADGYLIAHDKVTIEPGQHERSVIQLARGAIVEGTVRDDRGPVADAQVRSFAPRPEGKRWAQVDEARSDADGHFAVRAHPQAIRLIAAADGRVPLTRAVGADERGVTLQLDRAAAVRSRALDATTGQPIDRVHIGVSRPDGGKRQPLELHGVVAAADGAFELGELTPGTLHLRIEASGYAPQSREIHAAPGATVTLDDLRFQPQRTVRGRVLGPSGALAENAKVSIRPRGSAAGRWEIATTRTAADGTFSLRLPEGSFELRASHRTSASGGQLQFEVDDQAPTWSELSLSLIPWARIEGSVHLPPDARAQVIAVAGRTPIAQARVAASGTFALAELPPGTVRLGLVVRTDAGESRTLTDPVTLAAGETRHLRLPLSGDGGASDGAWLRCEVSMGGVPVRKGVVVAAPATDAALGQREFAIRAGVAEGAGLPTGDWLLAARSPYGFGIGLPVRVHVGRGDQAVHAQLGDGDAGFRGRFLGPVKGDAVTRIAYLGAQADSGVEPMLISADAYQAFGATGLAAGRYVLLATRRGEPHQVGVGTVDLDAGATADVALELQPAGALELRVESSSEDASRAGWWLAARTPAGDRIPLATTRSDADGQLRVALVPAATLEISVHAPDGSVRTRQLVDVPPGAAATLRVDAAR